MLYNKQIVTRSYITVSGTGDKHTGFYRNGINFKASKDTLNILRGFFMFKGYSFNRSFLCRLRVDKRIWGSKIKSRVLKGRTGRNAKHSISGISERKGDVISSDARSRCGGSHYNKKQYRINDFFSTCFNSYCFKGLVIRDITLYPLKDKFV